MLGRERECLGDPAAGGVEHTAEGAHRSGRLGGGGQERNALVGGHIEPLALGIVQLHHCYRWHHFRNARHENRPWPAANPLISRPAAGQGCYTIGNSVTRAGRSKGSRWADRGQR